MAREEREENSNLEVVVYLRVGHLARCHSRSPTEKKQHKDDKVKEIVYGTISFTSSWFLMAGEEGEGMKFSS